MDLIAINVLLDPDPATIERARATNARLRSDFPQGFTLDADHAPHVTLLQCFVRRSDLAAVATAARAAVEKARPVKWESRVTGYYALSDGQLGLMGFVVEPTADLHRVQGAVIAALAPYAAHGGTGDAFAPRADGEPIGQATVDYVNSFVGPRTGENFNPHLTVGIGTIGFVEAVKAEPFTEFPIRPVSVSLYQLGEYGTARRKLHDLHRC